jgi:hypothetical protein
MATKRSTTYVSSTASPGNISRSRPRSSERKGILAVFGENEERRAAADVGKVQVKGDCSAPLHLATRNPKPGQAREPDGVAVVGTCPGSRLHLAVVRDPLVLSADPGHIERGGVPPDRERAARKQDPQRLRDRAGGVGPLPRLRIGDEVVGCVRERQSVAIASDDRYVRELGAEPGGHGIARLDAEHVGPAPTQQSGGDSGASTDVGDAGAGQGTTRELFDQIEERRWVRGPAGRVLVSGGVERMSA